MIKDKEKAKNFIIYVIIGSLGGILEIVLFTMLRDYLHIHYIISNLISFSTTVILLYFLNGIFVFKSNVKNLKSFVVFFISRIFGFFLDSFVLTICLKGFGLNSALSKFISSISTTIVNYNVGKRIFKNFIRSEKRRNNRSYKKNEGRN